MKRSMRSGRDTAVMRKREAEARGVGERIQRQHCEYADKVVYTSKDDVRKAHRINKDVRAYRCTAHPSHFHATTEWKK